MRLGLFFWCVVSSIFSGCKSQSVSNDQLITLVPFVQVDIFEENPILISTPGAHYIRNDVGFKGIIIYNIDGRNFRAFDLASPYLTLQECDIPMRLNDKGELHSVCREDDIRFTQFKTSVTIGKNTYHLRAYNAYIENDILKITNF